jgi:hypothetical protein
MVGAFAKIAGALQAVLGMLTAASPVAAASIGVGSGASAFNFVSGVVLSVLGWKGSETALRSGSQVLGGANLLIGVLGLLGIDRVSGLALNATILGSVINVGIGIWGLVSSYPARP